MTNILRGGIRGQCNRNDVLLVEGGNTSINVGDTSFQVWDTSIKEIDVSLEQGREENSSEHSTEGEDLFLKQAIDIN